ncbi:hypothetical protein FRC17_008372, partial [Serendipita sp. 399]
MASPTSTRRPRETNLSVAAEREKLANRTSRVDLDFEEALASQNTFKLHEGRDFSAMGKELDSPTTTHEGGLVDIHTPAATAASAGESSKQQNQSTTSRKLHKARHSMSPTQRGRPSSATTTGPNGGGLPFRPSSNSSRPSFSEYSDATSSPAPSNRELPGEGFAGAGPVAYNPPPSSHRSIAESKAEDNPKRRGLFRSGGTVSTPDLATVGRKKSRGSVPKVPPLPTGDYDDSNYPSTDVAPGPMSGWTATLTGRNRSTSRVDSKGSKTLKAKTGTFLAKVFSSGAGGGTVRERSKSGGESSTPTTPSHRTHFAHTFDSPPVPSIPQEFKSGPSNVTDVFSPSSSSQSPIRTVRRYSKPLPPVSTLGTSDSSHHHDMLVSPIDSTAGSVSSHSASPQLNRSSSPTGQPPQSPSRRPTEVVTRIQANSSADGGRRRRSMSVGDVEQWNKVLNTTSTPSKGTVSTSAAPSIDPLSKEPSPSISTSKSTGKEGLVVTKEWENVMKGWGWDSQIAQLEIKDPATLSPLAAENVKGRPRSRTQDPIPAPEGLGLGRAASTSSGGLRTASVGSPPSGFRLSSSGSNQTDPGTPSVYETPPSGSTPTTPQFTISESPTTPKRPVSAGRTPLPYIGPIVIGSTPASIGHTITTVKIQRSPSFSTTSPKPSESSGFSSPGASASRTSSSNRPSSPQLQPSTSPRSATSPRVSSLRNTARPSPPLGTPSISSVSNTGNLRPPGRTESMPSGTAPASTGSPKISLSLTSPSQENVGTGGRVVAGRELKRMSYNPASASEPSLVPPSTYGADDQIKTIRLITSGSKLSGGGAGGGGGGVRRGDVVGENGEMMPVTRLSSPTS